MDELYDRLTDHDLDPTIQALLSTIRDPPDIDNFILNLSPLISPALLPTDQHVSLADAPENTTAVSSPIPPIVPSIVSTAVVNTVRTRPIEVIDLDRPLSDFQPDLCYRQIPRALRVPTGLFHVDYIAFTILWRNIMTEARRRAVPAALRLPMMRYHKEWFETVKEWLDTARREIYDIALSTRAVEGQFWQPEFGR
jgi:hypothetical protein